MVRNKFVGHVYRDCYIDAEFFSYQSSKFVVTSGNDDDDDDDMMIKPIIRMLLLCRE